MPPPPRKKPGPATVTPQQVESRARGCLLGLAVGDAMGTTTLFKRLGAPTFPTLCEGPFVDIVGKGPLAVRLGQVTQATQLACALAEPMLELGGYDAEAAARAYVKWLPSATDASPETRSALEKIAAGCPWDLAGKRVWLEGFQKPTGNGALCRVPPIAIVYAHHQRERIDFAVADAQLTHFAPLCQLANVIAASAIATCLRSAQPSAPVDDVLLAIEADLSIAAAHLGRLWPDFVVPLSDAATWLRQDVQAARDDDPMLYGPDLHLFRQEHFVRVCLRLGLWQLFHAPSLEAAVIDVVNRGGDTVTNAAFTGALLGARDGDAAVPERWIGPVMEALGIGPPSLTRLWTHYHPRHLVLLADKVKPPAAAPPRPGQPGGPGGPKLPLKKPGKPPGAH